MSLKSLLTLFMCTVCLVCNAEVVLNLESDALRLNVRGIVLKGFSETSDQAISLKALNRLIQQERAQYPADMTLDELHQIADVLTLHVRNKGYLFHTIFMPPQRVQNGLVSFRYQQARLADINIINRSTLPSAIVSRSLQHLLQQPLYAPAVEKRILALKAQANIQAFAFYSRGEKANEVRLNVKISVGKRFNFSLKAENYGSDITGENRLVANATLHRVTNTFDELSLALLTTAGEGDTVYGYMHYARPFSNLNTVFNVGVGDSQYSLGHDFSVLDMSGNSRTYRADIEHRFYLGTHKIEKIRVGAYQKDSGLNSRFDESLNTGESVQALQLGNSGQFSFANNHRRLSYSVDTVFGSAKSGTQLALDEDRVPRQDMQKLSYSFLASQLFASESRMAINSLVNIRGQSSPKALPSIESMGLSGIYGVRAIAPGRYSADKGTIATAELHWPALMTRSELKPLAESLQLVPVLFFDWASGDTMSESSTDSSITPHTRTQLSGWGIGLHGKWRAIHAKISWASPFTETVTAGNLTQEFNNEPQWFFELRW